VLIKESITVSNDKGIETISFANGVTWNRTQMVSNIAYVGGTTGNETITGSTGNDIIMAGGGNDTLVGLAGNDSFVFETGFGKDVVTDFIAGSGVADVIRIKDGLFANYTSVLAASSQVGSDTVLAYDISNTITLKNVTMSNLNQDDFVFG